jgi:hypothetical protein
LVYVSRDKVAPTGRHTSAGGPSPLRALLGFH